MPSFEETQSGDSAVGSPIFGVEVTQVVKKLLWWAKPRGWKRSARKFLTALDVAELSWLTCLDIILTSETVPLDWQISSGNLVFIFAAKPTKGTGNHPGSEIRVYGDESSDKVAAGTFVPYCSMAHAQLCFHGHRDAVKFFTAVPGHALPSTSSCGDDKTSDAPSQDGNKSMLVMSGGEGYIDFRMGDEEAEVAEVEDAPMKLQSPLSIAERSHLIVWQVVDNDK